MYQALAAQVEDDVRSFTIRKRGGELHSFLDSQRCQDAVEGLPSSNFKVVRSRKRLDYQATIRWTAKGSDLFNQFSIRLESNHLGVKHFREITREEYEQHFPELVPYMHLNGMTAVGPVYMFDNAIYYAIQGDIEKARAMTCLRAKPDSFFKGDAEQLRARFSEALDDLMVELEVAITRLGLTY